MAEEQARAERPAASSAPSSGGRGRGFLAGLVGGVLGAGGSIYALQIPEVRNALPLPQAAELVVNPDAVTRLSALEQEVAQLRAGVSEAEETGAIDVLSVRVEQLSEAVTSAATANQLEALRAGLSPLASAEGAAALEEAVAELEGRVVRLDAETQRLADIAATLEGATTAVTASVDELVTRVELDEQALVERKAELAGRVDAFARDVASVREAIGGADARLAQMRETTTADLRVMGERVDGIDAKAGDATDDVATLLTRLEAAEEVLGQSLAEAQAAMTSYQTALTGELDVFRTEVGGEATSAAEQAAAAAAEARAATELAEASRLQVATALARTGAAMALGTTAREIDRALMTGEPLESARRQLAEFDAASLEDAQKATIDGIAATLDAHADGVPTAVALKVSLDNLRPALSAAAAPRSTEPGLGRSMLDVMGVRPVGVSAEVEAALQTMDVALATGDVGAAIEAASAMPEAVAPIIDPWIDTARAHHAVQEARVELLSLGRDLAATASAS